jgi:hypothetical protein
MHRRIHPVIPVSIVILLAILWGHFEIAWIEGAARAETLAAPDATPPAKPKPKIVPAILIKKAKISGDDPHLPEVVKAQRVCSVVTGSYRVCIGSEGTISDVSVVQGIPGADAQIADTVKKWRYQPQPVPVCFVQFFEFHIDGGPECEKRKRAQAAAASDDEDLPPPPPSDSLVSAPPAAANVPAAPTGTKVAPPGTQVAPMGLPPGAKVVPMVLIQKDKLSGADPHLPDKVKNENVCKQLSGTYLVCLNKDGSVDRVDSIRSIPGADDQITDTVWRWRYKPQAVPICFFQVFEFRIDSGLYGGCELRTRSRINTMKWPERN